MLQHLEFATTAPTCKTAINHRDCLANCIKAASMIENIIASWSLIQYCGVSQVVKKSKPVYDFTVCYRSFQSPTNRDVARTEKRITHNQIGNVPKIDKPIFFQLQDWNGPGKNKAHVPIASQHFSFFVSKLIFSSYSFDRWLRRWPFWLPPRSSYEKRHSRTAVKHLVRIST